ncbi:zinc finger MYM-type protein 1 [Hydra vulgaris]|uniref:zinc finger MYM-type protein 1 n=1 Tax=Hydra vulgaris TaxID=6087 RepID=UPI0032EA6940
MNKKENFHQSITIGHYQMEKKSLVLGLNIHKSSLPALEGSGLNDWKNIGALLSSHEKSNSYLVNFQMWKELDIRLSTEKTIDHINEQKINEKEQYWQRILERLIALVRVLATQNLAFRGTNEKLYNNANGNFLKFVEYLALFDPLMNEHVRKIKNQENKTAHYLGKEIQNELIQILANAIKDNILTRVKFAKYYSIILDCTPDNRHREKMTIIILFVDLESPASHDGDLVKIKEHFLGFIPVEKSTGGFLAKTLIEQLKNFNLPIENLRGQGYDNGSNMKGKENGVQKKILDINPRAFFIPCSAHSLNLVVNDACKCSLDAISFFGVVQQIYSYFLGSPSRWQVFRSYFPDFTVKSLNDTRWESRINALKPLRYNLGKIYDALMQIFEDPRLQTTSVGNSSRNEAKGLANSICIFKLMVALVSWYDILFKVNISNKILQNKKVDLNVATQLNITKNKLVKMRNDEGFQIIIVDAAEIAKELETVTNFEEKHVGRRRKKQHFDYETQDEALQDPKEKFKVEFYSKILDTAIQSIAERFEQMRQYNSMFGFLHDIYSISSKSSAELLKNCRNLEEILTHGSQKDISAADLCNEIKVLSGRLPQQMPPHEVLTFIVEQRLIDCLPNICISLRILLTLPVSVASGERSFSKLKIIKNYLRSTMLQERLVGLSIISIKHEESSILNLKEIVKTFATKKPEK